MAEDVDYAKLRGDFADKADAIQREHVENLTILADEQRAWMQRRDAMAIENQQATRELIALHVREAAALEGILTELKRIAELYAVQAATPQAAGPAALIAEVLRAQGAAGVTPVPQFDSPGQRAQWEMMRQGPTGPTGPK